MEFCLFFFKFSGICIVRISFFVHFLHEAPYIFDFLDLVMSIVYRVLSDTFLSRSLSPSISQVSMIPRVRCVVAFNDLLLIIFSPFFVFSPYFSPSSSFSLVVLVYSLFSSFIYIFPLVIFHSLSFFYMVIIISILLPISMYHKLWWRYTARNS